MKKKIELTNKNPRYSKAGLLFFLPFLFLWAFTSCENGSKPAQTDFSQSIGINDSIKLLTESLKKDSLQYDLWKKRAALFLKKGNIDASFRDLNQALELKNDDPDLYILLADVYFAIGQKENSLSSVKKAIELDPNRIEGYLKMAKFKLMLEKYHSAESFADKVLSLEPENAQALYIKAISNLEQKDTVRALQYMKVAANADSQFFAAFLNIAVLLDAQNDTTAEKYYQKALSIKPSNLITEYSLAMFYQKHGKFDQALKTYAHITEQNPAHAQSFFNQGYIYLTEFLNYKKAVEMFQKAIEADPNYTEAVYNLGRTYEAMGDTLKAKEKYREALKLTTNYPLAIEGLNRLEE